MGCMISSSVREWHYRAPSDDRKVDLASDNALDEGSRSEDRDYEIRLNRTRS